ncbi:MULTISPECIES: hypothetical protein [Brevundimonas]|uniref:hypothetical protein n=1 Tax=Brevundimonas sp. UBA7507 TaxID=1946137 RepID=UPI00257945F2|nr:MULTISPECIES: hypothetical protein [Brevundimonas]
MSRANFRTVMEQEGGQWTRYRVLECRCGAEGRIKDTAKRPLASSPCAQAFRRAGWTSVRPDRGVCPACSAPKPKPAPIAQESIMAVEPPRQPSTEDRRRIREALFETYLEDRGCYAKAHSDRSVAKGLNVPFAWVAAARETLGFGPDVNEAGSAFSAEIGALKAELKALQDEALQAFVSRCEELDKRIGQVERAGYRVPA